MNTHDTQRWSGSAGPMLAVLLALSLAGCAYSFTGASVPPEWKTIAIPLVEDQSGYGEPGLREEFTTMLTTLFINDNSLQVSGGTTSDLVLSGAIAGVVDAPTSVGGEEQVRVRRVTVTVRYRLKDMTARRDVWEKTFTNWGDYPWTGGSSQVRAGLEEAMRKLTEDILLETVSGW
jgi:hypothetical protein